MGGSTAQLTIRDFNKKDLHNYHCAVTNNYGTEEAVISLEEGLYIVDFTNARM